MPVQALKSRWIAIVLLIGSIPPFAAAFAAREGNDPLSVIRVFTRADGNGDRLQPRNRRALAPRLTWSIEPAWDRIILIRGIEFGTLLQGEDTASADVTYTVVGEINGGRIVREGRLETITLTLTRASEDGSWRVDGVPPPPHIFESNVDLEELLASIDSITGSFSTNSVALCRGLGLEGSLVPTVHELYQSPNMEVVADPAVGDIAFYTNAGIAYHAGLVRPDGLILSATVDRGVVALPMDAFPGELQFRKFRIAPTAIATPLSSPEEPAAGATASPETAAPPAAAPL